MKYLFTGSLDHAPLILDRSSNIKTMSLEHHYFNQFANGRSILQINDTRSEGITLIGFSGHKSHLPSEKITNKLTYFYNRVINIAFDTEISMCTLSYRYVVYNRLIISYRVLSYYWLIYFWVYALIFEICILCFSTV